MTPLFIVAASFSSAGDNSFQSIFPHCDVTNAVTFSQAKTMCAQEVAGVAMDRVSARVGMVLSKTGFSKEFHDAVKVSQENWLTFTKSACEADTLVWENGSLTELRRATCLRNLAEQRSSNLQTMLEEMDF
ncbi:MAG: lysozyme inhibitor LprI family protein [Pseudomonadota bacterium]